jgi:hypothetical protein
MIKLKTKGKNKNKINKVRATKVLAFFSLAPINCWRNQANAKKLKIPTVLNLEFLVFN